MGEEKVKTKDRANYMLSLHHFNEYGVVPDNVGFIDLQEPNQQNEEVLRMVVQKPHTDILLPKKYSWLEKYVAKCVEFQNEIGIKHPFMYLTIRRGNVDIQDDDKWHTDGFSMKYSHLPEQNYIWTNCQPTEFLYAKFKLPVDFDPLKHNLHQYIQDYCSNTGIIVQAEEKTIYCLDPYIVHRKPKLNNNQRRIFIRLTMCQHEIMDDMNAQNPLLPNPKYNRIGFQVRNKLERYIK